MIVLKYSLTIIVLGFLVFNCTLDPHELAPVIGESRPEYKPEARATAFALIAALAAIVNIIPTGRSKLPVLIHLIGKFAPLAGATLAGWFALYAATENNPLQYLHDIGYFGLLFLVLAAFIVVLILVLIVGPVLIFSVFVSKLIDICRLVWRGARASLSKPQAAYQVVISWCNLIRIASSNQIRRFLRRR